MPSRWVEKRAHMEATPSTEFAVGRVHICFSLEWTICECCAGSSHTGKC